MRKSPTNTIASSGTTSTKSGISAIVPISGGSGQIPSSFAISQPQNPLTSQSLVSGGFGGRKRSNSLIPSFFHHGQCQSEHESSSTGVSTTTNTFSSPQPVRRNSNPIGTSSSGFCSTTESFHGYSLDSRSRRFSTPVASSVASNPPHPILVQEKASYSSLSFLPEVQTYLQFMEDTKIAPVNPLQTTPTQNRKPSPKSFRRLSLSNEPITTGSFLTPHQSRLSPKPRGHIDSQSFTFPTSSKSISSYASKSTAGSVGILPNIASSISSKRREENVEEESSFTQSKSSIYEKSHGPDIRQYFSASCAIQRNQGTRSQQQHRQSSQHHYRSVSLDTSSNRSINQGGVSSRSPHSGSGSSLPFRGRSNSRSPNRFPSSLSTSPISTRQVSSLTTTDRSTGSGPLLSLEHLQIPHFHHQQACSTTKPIQIDSPKTVSSIRVEPDDNVQLTEQQFLLPKEKRHIEKLHRRSLTAPVGDEEEPDDEGTPQTSPVFRKCFERRRSTSASVNPPKSHETTPSIRTSFI